jgi:hypothetical protein
MENNEIIQLLTEFENDENENSPSVNLPLPSETLISSNISAETKRSLEQMNGALDELKDFNNTLNHHSEGFELLEKCIEKLLEKTLELQQWHEIRHLSSNATELKSLLLSEIAILLILPYIHRLLTTEDRDQALDITNFLQGENDSIQFLRQELSFKRIDPVYTTRYEGVCLGALLSSVKSDFKNSWCFRKQQKISFWHESHAKLLASKFYGIISCLHMVINLGPHELENDLILEKAVGHVSKLEVKGIIEPLLLYNRHSAKQNLNLFTKLILTANVKFFVFFF